MFDTLHVRLHLVEFFNNSILSCFPIPFCCKKCKDAIHTCPNGHEIGIRRFMF